MTTSIITPESLIEADAATIVDLVPELDYPGTYLPSPAEIAAACAEIQSEWSDQERRGRAAYRGGETPEPWTAPVGRLFTDDAD